MIKLNNFIMSYYRITFYTGTSIIAEVTHFKKFVSFENMITWSNAVRVKEKYTRYLHKEITFDSFINN